MIDNGRRARLCRVFAALFVIAAACLAPAGLAAQEPAATVEVRARSGGAPVVDARVRSGPSTAFTDERGEARLALPAGEHTIEVDGFGLRPATVTLSLVVGADTTLVVEMEPQALEVEEIIVASTRTGRRIEDEPVRVEVVEREEIEEKLLMTPGDISMLLNETAGLRVQPTSPALGGAGVRIQGMRGRYTRILSDGLPLHGGQTGALGPLQIPPMDLARVEVIKGAASALYGASALGGVVNLISRRPAEGNERELLLNQSTLGGTDVILWNSGPVRDAWGYTLLAGAHRQEAADVDDDAWADLPGFRRASVRPRVFWNGARGASAMVTLGAMLEEREGGFLDEASSPVVPDYVESLSTHRFDAGAVARFFPGESLLLSVRGSGSLQSHGHRFGEVREDDRHRTGFAEAALSGGIGPHTWVAGLALQRETYAADHVEGFDYTHTVPGVFVQADLAPTRWLSVSGSGRLDRHSRYGTFFSPRVSVLLRPAEGWTVRGSAGGGYFAPTPWTDETEAVGLGRVVPPRGLDAERARTASLDVGRTFGPVELNATVFGSTILDPVQVRLTDDDRLELFNAAGPVRTRGTELLARYHAEGLHVTATHVYARATEPGPSGTGRREVPLTPRHTAGVVAAWEQEGRARVGIELYYTGRQELEENPYRSASEPHLVVGFLAERRFGRVRLFLNAENVFDTRQTRHDRLVLPARSPEGRWTTDVWAPLEGRAFNGGVRWEL